MCVFSFILLFSVLYRLKRSNISSEFILPYTKELYDHVKAEGGYVISHSCAAHAFYDLELKLEPHALNFVFGDFRLLVRNPSEYPV